MRILHALAQYPSRTGSGIYTINLIDQLTKHQLGPQALLYARNRDQAVPKLAIPTYPLVFDRPELPFPLAGMSDVMPYRSSIYHQMSQAALAAWQGAFAQKLVEAIDDFQPDLILCHHLWMLASLCLQQRVPVIAIHHGTDLRQARQNPDFAARYVKGLNRLKGVIALSQRQVPEIAAFTGLPAEQILVGGGAYNDQIFFPPAKKAPHAGVQFLYAGKLARAKGVFELVEAFRGLPADAPYRLSVVGNRTTPEAEQLAQRAETEERIHFFDVEGQALLSDQMRAQDIFVLPSYYEGLGMIAIEALACGMRLVVNDLVNLKEVLGPALWSDAHLSVVPMPDLQNEDEIVPEAIPTYLDQLQQALEEQARRCLADGGAVNGLTTKIHAFSWSALGTRIATWLTAHPALRAIR